MIYPLQSRFKPGTIGGEMFYDPYSLQYELIVKQQKESGRPIPRKIFKRVERAVLNIFSETDAPNPDEALRQAGLYDSTDKRCCINRKRR